MSRSRCPRKLSVGELVQLVVSVVTALARLIEVVHHYLH
jgi:hypothetical protein